MPGEQPHLTMAQEEPVPSSAYEYNPPSNALGIWALIFSITGCCSLVGLILGIIGLCKYPPNTTGRTLSLLAVIIYAGIMLISLARVNPDQLQEYYQKAQESMTR